MATGSTACFRSPVYHAIKAVRDEMRQIGWIRDGGRSRSRYDFDALHPRHRDEDDDNRDGCIP